MPMTLSTPSSPVEGETVPVPWFAAPPVDPAADSGFPSWYLERRRAAWQRFLDTPDPQRRDEAWRFADLRKARFCELTLAAPVADPDDVLARADRDRLSDYAARFVFAGNRLLQADVRELPEGAICLPLAQALARHGDLVESYFMTGGTALGGGKFASLHEAATLSGVFIHLPEGARIERPVQIQHYVGGDFQTSFPHLLAVASRGAELSVYESYHSLGAGDQSLSVAASDLHALEGGRIQYASLQDLSDEGAKHVQIQHAHAHRDGSVMTAFVNLGAAWVRQESVNRMLGEGSDIQVLGASLANGGQEYDQRTLQVHESQRTTSDLLFKNALYDQSRTIFSGLIQVLPGAHHTDSFQTCRNLLGSDEAEANSMPGLEIDADQVKCSHGSTSSQISDEEIFYLRARGIDPRRARRMISLGFLTEPLMRLRGDELRERLAATLERKFDGLE
jgi:Fe-S cluster assembly protein SufD